MSLFRAVLLVALCALPGTASAQPWKDAYQAGDHQKAADLLHPLVIQLRLQPASMEPDPAHHLATMYALGLGVSRDPIAACSLAQVAAEATSFSAPKYAQNIEAYNASVKDANAFVTGQCDKLTERERMVASLTAGCFAFGMPEKTFTLGTDTVHVGRGGIRVADVAEERPDAIMNCPMLVARVRPLTLNPPPDAAPGVIARHFVDLLIWQVGQKPGDTTFRYTLQWQLYEVRGKKIEIAAIDEFGAIDQWPQPALPENLDARLSIEMIRSGHVHWKLDGKPPKRGWVMLPEQER